MGLHYRISPRTDVQSVSVSSHAMSSSKGKGANNEVRIDQFKGKFSVIVFYPRDTAFSNGVKAFAEAKDKFLKQKSVVLVCNTDHSWSTWSTSPGIKLKGVMAVKSLSDALGAVTNPPDKEVEWGSDAWFDCENKCSVVILDPNGIVRHVVSSSMSPRDAVEHCVGAVTCLRSIRMRDAELERKVDKESKFAKRGKVHGFPRKSFYEMELDQEAGQLKLLGEADLESQFHLPLLPRLMAAK